MTNIKPEDFTLSEGAHGSPKDGMCVMEMVSFLAGEEWSDMPKCASPVIAKFCQGINDCMGQGFRDKLQSYVPRLLGTVSPEHEQERAEYLAWQAIKVLAPIALERGGLRSSAQKLRDFDVSLGLEAAHAVAHTAAAYAAAYATAYANANAHANAAHAATYAAATANAAAHAAYAARADENAILAALDGVLAIGPSGTDYLQEHLDRMPALREAVGE